MHGFIVVDLFPIGIINYNRLFNPLNLGGQILVIIRSLYFGPNNTSY